MRPKYLDDPKHGHNFSAFLIQALIEHKMPTTTDLQRLRDWAREGEIIARARETIPGLAESVPCVLFFPDEASKQEFVDSIKSLGFADYAL